MFGLDPTAGVGRVDSNRRRVSMAKAKQVLPFAVLPALLVPMLLAGCQTAQQALAADSDAAIHAALTRARFEMNCPAATGTVLSSTMLQPVLWGGIERAEYQIGVSGCDKRATYIVICPEDGSSCLATGNRAVPGVTN
jgi:hypothetical protein